MCLEGVKNQTRGYTFVTCSFSSKSAESHFFLPSFFLMRIGHRELVTHSYGPARRLRALLCHAYVFGECQGPVARTVAGGNRRSSALFGGSAQHNAERLPPPPIPQSATPADLVNHLAGY